MFNINYSNESLKSIDNFILYLSDYYKRIYFDTWIVDEYQIIDNYIEKTNKLFDEIIDTIENTIAKWVYWVILESNNKYELSKLVIHIRSYTISIVIKKSKEIFIKSIFIN